VKASAAIVDAVATGALTPSEAAELCRVIDSFARVLQAAEFETRLDAVMGRALSGQLMWLSSDR
jgi:hypothetical protein